jgi:cytochrome-b5 reductase
VLRITAAPVAAGVAASACGISFSNTEAEPAHLREQYNELKSRPEYARLLEAESRRHSSDLLEAVSRRHSSDGVVILEDGLSPNEWRPLKLQTITPLSHDTAVYRFAYSDMRATSGMRVASCLWVRAAIGSTKADGSRANVIRPYTPISRPDDRGFLDLAVKTYPDGKMSQHVASLKVGETLEMKGPVVKLPYRRNEHARIGMVAGGTGIAPMLQVIDEILVGESAFGPDRTKVSLIFANVSEQDILLKQEVDRRAAAHPDRLEVFYLVDQASSVDWRGGVGYVTKQMLAERMPPPGSENRVFVCGPPPMVKAVCGAKGTKEDRNGQGELSGMLKELGYSPEEVFKF